MECVFCQMIQGTAPHHKIWEDEKHLAILSIFPNTQGFSVVLTKEHYDSYVANNDDQVVSDLMLAVKKVSRLIDSKLEDVGRTGVIFEGFGVDHLHAKLFPMHGTADMKKWKRIENKQRLYYDQYPGYISSHDFDRADDESLAQLAKQIRE